MQFLRLASLVALLAFSGVHVAAAPACICITYVLFFVPEHISKQHAMLKVSAATPVLAAQAFFQNLVQKFQPMRPQLSSSIVGLLHTLHVENYGDINLFTSVVLHLDDDQRYATVPLHIFERAVPSPKFKCVT